MENSLKKWNYKIFTWIDFRNGERTMSFEGKVAVVTGGAHGISRAVADAFIKEQAKVHIIDCTPGE